MKKYILLMLLISCQEEETLKRRNPFMTISNAIPVQFWINGVETYNETAICGVEDVCFCQPFNCSDEITIQVNGDADQTFSTFANSSANGAVVAWTFLPLTATVDNGPETTQYAYASFNSISGRQYMFDYNIDYSSGVDPTLQDANVRIYLLNSSFVPVGNAVMSNSSSGASQSGSVTVTATGNGSYVALEYRTNDAPAITLVVNSLSFNAFDMEINAYDENGSLLFTDTQANDANGAYTYTFTPISKSICDEKMNLEIEFNNVLFAKSDCLDVKTSHDCTQLINYTNTDNFSNIVYETSPAVDFNIRVPAQFWKEDNPMEQEDSELSNGVIKTRRQSIQEKRYLELGFMPNYMHKKVQLVLMHDTITIAGDQWKRRDAYESESIRRYPLKRANVWLTKYNSISDNII